MPFARCVPAECPGSIVFVDGYGATPLGCGSCGFPPGFLFAANHDERAEAFEFATVAGVEKLIFRPLVCEDFDLWQRFHGRHSYRVGRARTR